jgi:hypothetical protein
LIIIGGVITLVVIIALVALSVWGLLQNESTTRLIRDIFIIFMAFESLVIGLVLVILIIQLARLINLLENEVKPILASTNETVNNLRGTTIFLSENLVQPVIKLNEYIAALKRMGEMLGLGRK